MPPPPTGMASRAERDAGPEPALGGTPGRGRPRGPSPGARSRQSLRGVGFIGHLTQPLHFKTRETEAQRGRRLLEQSEE